MRMFGRPQGILGRVGGVIMARMNRDAAAQVIGMLDVRPGDHVLEVGFGPGVGVELLAQRIHDGAVAGVDPSPDMFRQATARNAQAIKSGKVDLRHAGAESLPFPDAAFDKVLSINSMQAWPSADAGLRELLRVLKRGGRTALAFTVNAGQQRTGVAETVLAAGFADVRTEDGQKLFCVIASKP
jgi:ubiquinone/menaquinone biosynthesis C-methylase UbiE